MVVHGCAASVARKEGHEHKMDTALKYELDTELRKVRVHVVFICPCSCVCHVNSTIMQYTVMLSSH